VDLVHRDGGEPASKGLGVAQEVDLREGDHEGVLRHVFARVDGPKETRAHPRDVVDVLLVETLLALRILDANTEDQRPIRLQRRDR
jgi:hypothetical protein